MHSLPVSHGGEWTGGEPEGEGMVVSLLRTLRSHYENVSVILELRPNVLIVAI